tara:strand:- start:4881 stop:5042 length:162 start_codon:yes stop_codon:yes gene_type:complete
MLRTISDVDLSHYEEKIKLAQLGHLELPRKAYVRDMTVMLSELKKLKELTKDG